MNEKRVILVIEDEHTISNFICRALSANDYKPIPAFAGKEGLSLYFSHGPDLVLLDLGLPDMDGIEVLQELSGLPPETPVIIISARDRESEKVKALDMGADDYIVKPFGVPELLARIRTTLRRADRLKLSRGSQKDIYHIKDLTVDIAKHQVLLDGEPLPSLAHKAVARKLAFLPQSRPVPDLTARRLVLHGRFPYLGYPRRYSKADYAAADAALAAVGAQALAERDLQALSGGERQKVFLAMALAQDAPTILLDEPTTYLDIDRQFEVMRLLAELRAQGKTVVAVLHDLSLAFHFADRVVLLRAGAIEADGTPDAVANSGALARAFRVAAHRIEVPGFGAQYVFYPLDRPL